jgi:hypothetical protein
MYIYIYMHTYIHIYISYLKDKKHLSIMMTSLLMVGRNITAVCFGSELVSMFVWVKCSVLNVRAFVTCTIP